MSRLPPAFLALSLLFGLGPQAVAAQDLGGLRRQAEVCLATPLGPSCQALLDASHQLKQAAEKREQWRCYTALLAVEAVLITNSFAGGSPMDLDPAFAEARQSCAGAQALPGQVQLRTEDRFQPHSSSC